LWFPDTTIINIKKKENLTGKMGENSLMISFTLSIYSVSDWRQYRRWGWEMSSPPPPFHRDRKYT